MLKSCQAPFASSDFNPFYIIWLISSCSFCLFPSWSLICSPNFLIFFSDFLGNPWESQVFPIFPMFRGRFLHPWGPRRGGRALLLRGHGARRYGLDCGAWEARSMAWKSMGIGMWLSHYLSWYIYNDIYYDGFIMGIYTGWWFGTWIFYGGWICRDIMGWSSTEYGVVLMDEYYWMIVME